ncbi:sigma-70 family RNA polymerase sigma factor [Micromonospora sp. WMMD1076]|uniref:ECF subfamily RNA polymerase sigma factor, BldN family n=1 Tax=Micromonospora TaxID=1873 RepID=UPI00249BA345|nr:ECF subfamily RNA polymerase sigma factor, BldN family [Micromonospora sp. WMMD1076]WFF07331.1 sigma-70 family RNA polymerase sigma factor [Micromonospora sp. WMMD1076]
MTTFGYAERPAGVTGPAQRNPLNERADPGPRGADGQLAVRGDGRRVRSRAHHTNEAPPRPASPVGNAKPATGRLGSPARPAMPAQARRGDAATGAEPSAAETAVLPAVTTGDTAVLPAVPAAAPATGFPSRPDPSDPATEVWTLVERAQAGESEAFGLIYDRYVDTVFRFVYFRVGNRQLAEDLTSDTFLRALKRIGSFTWQGRDLGAWLVTIARNLVADHFKSGRYRLEVTTGDVLDADREDRGPEGSPEAAVVEHITNVALLTAVKQLNPEQQECIVLRFLQGFSVAETARAMGKNEGAIKALQYRAVRALARLLPDGFHS